MNDQQRAHLRLMTRLAERITTHYRKEHKDRRGKSIPHAEQARRARNGRLNGPKASRRKNPGNPTRRG